MKRAIAIAAAAAALVCAGGVPIKWTVETSRADERVIDVYHGETLDIEVTFKSYGEILTLPTVEPAATFWQTNGMGTAYWRTNDVEVLSTNGIMRTHFGPEKDVGAKTLRGFIGIPGQIYRAAFVLRFKDAPGYDVDVVEWPYRVLDFRTIEVHNEPYYLKEEVDQISHNLNVEDVFYTNRVGEVKHMRHGWHINRPTGEDDEDGFIFYRKNNNGFDFPLYWFNSDGWIWLYNTNGQHEASLNWQGIWDGTVMMNWRSFLTEEKLVTTITENQTTYGAADAVAVKNYVEGRAATITGTTVPGQIAAHAETEASERAAAIGAVSAEVEKIKGSFVQTNSAGALMVGEKMIGTSSIIDEEQGIWLNTRLMAMGEEVAAKPTHEEVTNIADAAAAKETAARVEALSNAVYGVLGGLPDNSAVLSTNATGMVNKPVLGLIFTRELDASPENVKIYQPEMDYLAVNFLGVDTYMFTLAYELYDSWQLGTYPQLVMRYKDVTNVVNAATNTLAQSMGGTPEEITVTDTVPYSKGLVNLTVTSGGTLACNTNGWANGAQVMVNASLPAAYTAASGVEPAGYSSMPTDGQYLLVFTRIWGKVYVSVITSEE